MPRILWLDDVVPADAAPIGALKGAGFDVVSATAGLAAVSANNPDLVIWRANGDRALLRTLRAATSPFAALPLIMLMPEGDRGGLIAARLEGADDVLPGAIDAPMLLAVAASRLAQVGRVRAAAKAPSEPVTANRNQFAQRAMEAVRNAGADAKLSLRLVEVGDANRDAGEVVGALRDVAHDGQTAARLADNRYAVLTKSDAKADQGMETVCRDLNAQIASVAIAPGQMADADVMKAVSMTLRQFGGGGAPADVPPTLDRAFADMVVQAKAKLKGFREAMERRAYRLAYQPITSLKDGQPHHYEALVRFQAPELKNTGEVIAFAEQAGLAGQLDLAILDYALAVMNTSQMPADAKIAINISGQTVQNAEAMAPILQRINSRKSLTHRLQFELTESAEISDLSAANDVVQQIRFPGFKVYLDDFGAGAASFQYLHAIKVDGVKIDGRYVRPLPGSTKDATLLRGLVRLAHDLELSTVAECVETAEQAKLLAEIGVDFGQGWHFGKPTTEILARKAA
jgi:EAL domain-containing protein (putative c-di-GMP-specific phosphodiesterase class I)/CheY-like chemotaxis protein